MKKHYLCIRKPTNTRNMKHYTHDYTLASEAEALLYRAQVNLRTGDQDSVCKYIELAREKLQRYLSQDNMVEDDDVYPGWIKANEVDNPVYII